MSRFVAAWLDLPEGQGGRAVRMLALIFLLSSALSLMKAAQSGIFLVAYPRSMIPWAFAASSVLLASLSSLTVAYAQRLGTARLGTISLSWSAIAMVVLRALLLVDQPSIPFVLYVVIEAASGVLVIQVWAVASAATDARTARRLLPVAGIGAALAWTIAGLAVQPIVEVIASEGLLLLAPVLLGAAWWVARVMARLDLDERDRRGTKVSAPLAEAFRFVAKVPLLRMMAVLSILALVVEEVMDFHVMATARETLGDAEAISAFIGRYYAITSAIGILLLAGPAARVLGALGATRALIATPLVTAIAAVFATLVPGLTSAVLLRGTGRVLKQALWSNAQEQMQTPLSHARRAQARAATRGVLAPVGYAVCALGLAAIPEHVDERWLAALVLVLSTITVIVIATSARKTYLRALERAVDERRLFLGVGRAPRLAPLERDVIELLEREIRGSDAARAMLAAEMLGLSGDAVQIDRIALGLVHADARVRAASAEALSRIPDLAGARHLARALGREIDVEVRRAIVSAMRPSIAQLATARSDRAIQDALARAEHDADLQVASIARALCLRCTHDGPALGAALLPALRGEDPGARGTALDELTVEAAHAKGMQETLRALLAHAAPDVRIHAAERVIALGLLTLLPDVVVLLKDPATGPAVARVLVEVGEVAFGDHTRPAGASTLASLTEIARRIARSPGAASSDALLKRLLEHRDPAIRHHATFALADAIRAGRRAPLEPEVTLPLVEREVRRSFLLASILAGIARDDGVPDWEFEPHVRFLAREVELRIEASRAEVLELLLLRGASPRLVSAIEASRRAPSRERDAQVAELLEMALDPVIARKVVPVFERLSLRERIDAARRVGLVDREAIEDPLDAIVLLDDAHLRRCALLTYGARFEQRFPDLAEIDRPMIPRIERIRFLRSVPLFEGLSGEDLLSVADVLEQVEQRAGAAVFHEGDPGEDLYLVVRGTIAIEQGGVRIAELGEREFFGDLAVLDHQPRSGDALCVSDAQLLRLRGADLRELMVTRPPIVQGIVRVLVRRLRDAGHRRASHA
ncbi:cyclic nucleotide-binding domain-containing protein [Sandaracinus amylolyticus]|uniref:cAMP-binding protein n=1 Tax=Sandaracinus amylolyticus TaxID=927083 RepID=A0A0F6W5W5_9BACT|nr:cyclic nucleotide-binding domain-containing protein [Sandaracinus amylolyticus]AKF08300.1 cAMP-binding protein [Sandaracinus amylolyticus]